MLFRKCTYPNLALHTLLAGLWLAAGTLGCSSSSLPSPSSNVVSGKGESVNNAAQAITAGDMLSINGTYNTCTSRSGAWSLALASGATLTNSALTVVQNDSNCTLDLTSIVAGSDGDGGGTVLTYNVGPSFALTSSYQLTASEATLPVDGGAGPVAFYANAEMNPSNFSADFTVTLLYSDDSNSASGGNNSSYSDWTSNAVGDLNAAPDYTWADNLVLLNDANSVVTSATGSVDFTDGTTTGDEYVVDLGTLATTPTFAQVDATFTADAALDGGLGAVTITSDPSVPAASFSLDGQTLPVVRTVILRHITSNVPAYQLVTVTFNPAS